MNAKLSSIAVAALVALSATHPAMAAEAPLRGKAWQLTNKAYADYEAGRYQAAERDARSAIKLRPDAPQLRLLLVYSLQKQGKREQALSEIQAAEKAGLVSSALADAKRNLQTGGPSAGNGAPSAAFARGYPIAAQAFDNYNHQKYPVAEQQAEQAFRIDPQQGAWAILWIAALEAQGKLQQGLEAADTAIALGAPNANDLQARKQTLLKSMSSQPAIDAYQALGDNNTDAAVELARKAVQLAPDTQSHRLLLITTLLLNNDMAAAETAASDALKQDDEDTSSLVLRAYFRQRQGKTIEADQDFDQALTQDWLDDDQRRNIRLLAVDAALASGRYGRATAMLQPLNTSDKPVIERQKLIAEHEPAPKTLTAQNYPPPFQDCHDTPYGTVCDMKPADAAGASSASARAYLAYGKQDYPEAIRQAQLAVEQSPESPTMQRLLTITLASGNATQQAQAIERMNAELAQTPADVNLLMQRAYLRQRTHEFNAALEDFRAAQATGKAPPTVVLDEGYTLAAAGQKQQAVSTFKQAIDRSDSGDLSLSPEQRYNTRSAIAGLSREWGLSASTSYRGAQPMGAALNGGPISTAGDSVFGMVDAFWRPRDFLNDSKQTFEVYGRVMGTLHNSASTMAAQDYVDPCTGESFGARRSTNRGVAGLPTTIGALGVRFTPSTDYALSFGLERRFLLGSNTRSGTLSPESANLRCQLSGRDPSQPSGPLLGNPQTLHYQSSAGNGGWLAFVTYGFYKGSALRIDTPDWFTMEGYVQAGYSREDLPTQFWLTDQFTHQQQGKSRGRLVREQWFGNAELRAGRSFRLDSLSEKLVAFPHLVLAADYLRLDNQARIPSISSDRMAILGNGSTWSAGAGIGVSFRYGFREDKYNATRSYLDWTTQYRTNLGGGNASRAKGLFMNLSLWY